MLGMNSPSIVIPRKMESVSLEMEIHSEIRRVLTPYLTEGLPITGDTVICDGTKVDSLTVMDMMVELEDRFDVTIPMKQVVEIRTVDQLAATISRLVIR